MTPFIDLGGHPIQISEDRFADGRRCFVAEHTDIPGCVAYAESLPAALESLKEARGVFLQSVRIHEASTPVLANGLSSRWDQDRQSPTQISGAGLQLA